MDREWLNVGSQAISTGRPSSSAEDVPGTFRCVVSSGGSAIAASDASHVQRRSVKFAVRTRARARRLST